MGCSEISKAELAKKTLIGFVEACTLLAQLR